MSKNAGLEISADVLVWAREQRGLSTVEAAKRLSILEATLLAIGAGDRQPTLAQLRHMAEAYKRPLIVLLLEEPPRTFQAMRDFRSIDGVPPGTFSPRLHDELKRAVGQQDVYLKLRNSSGQSVRPPKLPPVGDTFEQLAFDLLELLQVSGADRLAWRQPREALGSGGLALRA